MRARTGPANYVRANLLMIKGESLILLGACLGAFGVRGELRVKAFTADPEGLAAYGPLYAADGRLVLTPKRVRTLKDGQAALGGPEVRDRDAAEALKGVGLHVPRSALPACAAEDEVYIADLIGAVVMHVDGRPFGHVRDVVNFGAGDLLQIETHGRRWLLPFTKSNVPWLQAGQLRIDPPAGLLPDPDTEIPE